jgi:cyclophilin family peptidyl-prolyl cis-trans isomerase/cytochrome c553
MFASHRELPAGRRARTWRTSIASAVLLSAGLWLYYEQVRSADSAQGSPPSSSESPAQDSAPVKIQSPLPRPVLATEPATAPDTAGSIRKTANSPQLKTQAGAAKAAADSALPSGTSSKIGPDRLVLRTVAGDMVVALYPDVAPQTVARVLELTRLGVYDTTHFGAMKPGFYLQLYNPEERIVPFGDEGEKAQKPIPIERSSLHHRRGTLSMPPAGGDDPDSASVSFSIMLGDAPHIDGKQTVFGQVVRGMDVLDRLEKVPLWNGTTRPELRLTILQAEVVSEPMFDGLVLQEARPLSDILNQEPSPALAVRANNLIRARCVRCHGTEKASGGLSLTSQAALVRGGQHGPAVYRGNSQSSLLRRRITATDASAMPRGGPPLSVADIALLTAWIDDGATLPPGTGPNAPETDEGSAVSAEDVGFWSFAPLAKVPPQEIGDSSLVRTPLDQFLLAGLEAKNLSFNPVAGREVLLRRLFYDLIGLPPKPEQIDDFVRDSAADAFERQVDRLLASPAFGEHQARDWLDLVRYADSGGYENDDNRPFAYTYRDFVIRAINDDLPYNTFLHWQIAGDEIAPDNRQALAATGFATAGPLQTFFPKPRDRYDELDDIVSTLGSAMLGLTVGCARCHDHKYDPIPRRDYYRLQAVFANSRREERFVSLDDGSDLRRQIDYFRSESERLEGALHRAAFERKFSALPSMPDADKALLRQPVDPNNARQTDLLRKFGPMIQVSDAEMFPDNDDRVALLRLTAQLDELKDKNLPKALTLAGSGYGRAFCLDRGDPDREREAVPPGFLTVLTTGRPIWNKHSWEAWSPRVNEAAMPRPRRALANWLTDVDRGAGRLVARVMVNRLWQHFFGEGLVRTPNDFGAQGDRPSHPEMLDWLAGELIANGWHLKPIYRLIVTSAAYRQASAVDPAKAKADPENRLFGRQRPRRLSAEMLRDALLAVAGNLNTEMYGPGIKPPIPTEAIYPTAPKHGEVWPADAVDGPANWRRSIYIVRKRSNPVPFLQTFDAPDTAASCGRRSTTTIPTQALILMNDPFVVSQSRRFADRVRAAAEDTDAARVRQAFRLAIGRSPDAVEGERSVRFLRDHSLAEFCQVLLQSNEFAYVD